MSNKYFDEYGMWCTQVVIGDENYMNIGDISLNDNQVLSGQEYYAGSGEKRTGTYIAPAEYPSGGSGTATDGLNTSYTSTVSTTAIKDYFFTTSLLGVKSASSLQNLNLNTSSLVTIGDYAAYNCPALNDDLTLSNTVTSIGQHAFDSCSLLGKVTANGVTNIGGYAFASCTSIPEIHMTSLLRSTSTMCFNQCSNCDIFNLPTFGSSSSYYIPIGCFNGCTKSGVVYILPSTFYISTSSTRYPVYANGEYVWYAKGTSSISLYRSDSISTLIATLTSSSTTYTDPDAGVTFVRTGSSKLSITHP